MPYNWISADNLVPGMGGRKPIDRTGDEMVVAAIKAALAAEYLTDDAVRAALGKTFDFKVTEAARAVALDKAARRVFFTIFDQIRRALVKGKRAQVADFASFFVGVAEDYGLSFVGTHESPYLTPYDENSYEILAAEWSGAYEYFPTVEDFVIFRYPAKPENMDAYWLSRYQAAMATRRWSRGLTSWVVKVTVTVEDGYSWSWLSQSAAGQEYEGFATSEFLSGETVVTFQPGGVVVVGEDLAGFIERRKAEIIAAGQVSRYDFTSKNAVDYVDMRAFRVGWWAGIPPSVVMQLLPMEKKAARLIAPYPAYMNLNWKSGDGLPDGARGIVCEFADTIWQRLNG